MKNIEPIHGRKETKKYNSGARGVMLYCHSVVKTWYYAHFSQSSISRLA